MEWGVFNGPEMIESDKDLQTYKTLITELCQVEQENTKQWDQTLPKRWITCKYIYKA